MILRTLIEWDLYEKAEVSVLLLGEKFGMVFLCEDFDGACSVAVFGGIAFAAGQTVCGQSDGDGAAVLDGEEDAASRRACTDADAACIFCLAFLCVYGVFEEVAEQEGEVESPVNPGGVSIFTSMGIFLARACRT